MKLCNLDEVVKLRNWRKNAESLRRCAESGLMTLKFSGFEEPSSCIALDCVRRAVMAECDREIANYEEQLKELGVEVY